MKTWMNTALLRLAAFVWAVGALAPAYGVWPTDWLNTHDEDVVQGNNW